MKYNAFQFAAVALLHITGAQEEEMEYNKTVKRMSRPTAYELSRFKDLPKNITMI
jgi:hypothetical protein